MIKLIFDITHFELSLYFHVNSLEEIKPPFYIAIYRGKATLLVTFSCIFLLLETI